MLSYTNTASGPLHTVDFGGHGPPIVLIHGLGGSTTNYDAVAPRLTSYGRVLAIDLPGFGLSPPQGDFRLETHRTAIENYLVTLDGPAVLLGNSTGAMLAEMVASDRPDLVAGLILLAPATPPVIPDRQMDLPTAIRLAMQATPFVGEAIGRYFIKKYSAEELVQTSMAMITHKSGRVPLAVIEASIDVARIRMQLPWTVKATARTATAIALSYLRRADFVRMIRKIVAPTLVVQGIEDHIVSPTAVEWICNLRPDWQLVQMTDTGHTPQLDAPLRLLDVVEPWLAGTVETAQHA